MPQRHIVSTTPKAYVERAYPSPFMILAYPVRLEKRSVIPAPTHVDGTGWLQTVSRQTNPRYWHLIKEFERPALLERRLRTSARPSDEESHLGS
ncbi:MAG: carbamoyltransferase C-terminal domain-containing protein [Armatimonadota bacterium]|nr:carbamoyltransferase C-terminal domain-containing protein [Armatimonadota bacterium]